MSLVAPLMVWTTDWLDRMLTRKPVKVVAIALAARMARTVWALIARGESYRAVPG